MWGYHGTNINIRVLLVPGCIQWGLEVKTTHPPQTSQHFIKGLVKCRLLGGVEVYLCSFMWRWLNNIHFWLFFVGNFRGFIPQNQLSNDTKTPPNKQQKYLKTPPSSPKESSCWGVCNHMCRHLRLLFLSVYFCLWGVCGVCGVFHVICLCCFTYVPLM